MLTTPARLTSYPFNIGANKLLVNRANIRKHYTEILIAVRNGIRLKTSNNLIAVICVCWVLQLKNLLYVDPLGASKSTITLPPFTYIVFNFLFLSFVLKKTNGRRRKDHRSLDYIKTKRPLALVWYQL